MMELPDYDETLETPIPTLGSPQRWGHSDGSIDGYGASVPNLAPRSDEDIDRYGMPIRVLPHDAGRTNNLQPNTAPAYTVSNSPVLDNFAPVRRGDLVSDGFPLRTPTTLPSSYSTPGTRNEHGRFLDTHEIRSAAVDQQNTPQVIEGWENWMDIEPAPEASGASAGKNCPCTWSTDVILFN